MNQDFKLPDPPARTAPVVEHEEPKPDKGMSPSGFARNALHDAYDQLKGIYNLFPTIFKEGVKVAKAYKDLPKIDLENVLEGFGENLKAAGRGVIQPYQEHGARVWYEKPVTTLSDALAVWGLTAKSAGIAGRMAGGVVRKVPLTMADKVVTMAKTIEELPAALSRKGIDKTVLKLSGGQWDLAKRREFLNLKAAEMSQVPQKIKADMEAVGKQISAFDDAEAELFHRWRTQGATVKDLASNPKVANALDAWGKTIGEYQEILKKRGILSDAQIEEVLAKKYAAEVFGDLSTDSLAKAREAIKVSEVKPIYGPSLFDKKGMTLTDYVDEVLNAQAKKPGAAVGFLEEYKGKAGSIADPRKYVPMHIATFRNVEGKLRFRDRLLQTPELTGAPKGMKALEGPAPGDIPKRYYEDSMRWEQASEKFTDPTIKRLLQMEATRPQGGLRTFLRVYDKILNAFRMSATVLNPRWYTGNAVGDAVIGTLAGAEAIKAQRLGKMGSLPPQVAPSSRSFGISGEATGVGGVLEKATEIGNSLDQAVKAGVVVKEVGRKLKEAGVSAEASMEAMESVLKSTQEFSNVQVEMQLLQEQIARSSDKVRRIDSAILKTQAKERQLIKVADSGGLSAVRQRIENLQAAKDAIVRDIADDMAKNGALEKRIPGLREQNQIVQTGIDRANAFLGDYLSMDAFEQGVMRRLIPFYTWAKAMNMLAFRLPFLSPVKSFMWSRYSEAMMSMANDPELPEWAQGSVPLYVRENGDMIWFKLSGFSPFSGLRVSKVGEVPVPGMFNLFESSPAFSLAFKVHGGKTIFDKGTVPHAGESFIFIGDGTGYEVTPNGKLEKTITQAPLISSIAHSFPVVQYLEELALPFKVNKYGWHGLPSPTYNQDGTYKYPRELWQRLWGAAGVNLDARTRESMIRSKKLMEKEFIDNATKAFRKAGDPEERALIREAVRDYFRVNR